MLVTINTDASFAPAHERGSYAFWIVCNEWKVTHHGMLRKKILRPEIAEFMCIINALQVTCKKNTGNVHHMIINTDCLNVIHLLSKNKKAIKRWGLEKWGTPYVKKFHSVLHEHGMSKIKIEYRHVKSHTGIGDKRSYVNEWCDTEAKLELKKFLETKQKQ